MGIKYSQFKQDYNHRIHRAVARSDIKTLKYLLEKSVADIDVIEDGHLPINIALHGRNDAIINLLIDSGCDLNPGPECIIEPLRQAVFMCHVAYVKYLINQGANVNARDIEGNTALNAAVFTKHKSMPEIIDVLLLNGIDVNSKNKTGLTALHECCKFEKVEEAKRLSRYCDINIKSTDGKTALMEAVVGGHFSMVVVLIENGCDIDIPDDQGTTPLMAAINTKQSNIIDLLLQKGAKQNCVDKSGMTPLHFAAQTKDLTTMARLVKNADVDHADRMKRTPLTISALMGSLEGVTLLLQNGANVTLATIEGRTPTHIVAHNGRIDIAELLYKHGADISSEDKTGKTPFLIAASEDRVNIVNFLLAKGVSLNHRDSRGRTALYLATQQGHLATTDVLLKAGAMMDVSDKEGNAPLHMSLRFPSLNIQLMWLLVQKGCDPINLHNFLDWIIENDIIPRTTLFADKNLEEWYNLQKKNPSSLRHTCRVFLHQTMRIGQRDIPRDKMCRLPLPNSLVDYLSLKLL